MERVLAGDGVSLAWRWMIDNRLASKQLVMVGPEFRSPRSGCYLAWPQATSSECMRKLGDWLSSLTRSDFYKAGSGG
tara:strand:+ start:112 stop:342 length:231 start_codon:yes stop_codon:yes gene_type:complete